MKLETLGDFIEARHGLDVHCYVCQHMGRLDLDALKKRYGRGAPIDGGPPPRIAGRAFKCTECGARSCRFQVRPPTPDATFGFGSAAARRPSAKE